MVEAVIQSPLNNSITRHACIERQITHNDTKSTKALENGKGQSRMFFLGGGLNTKDAVSAVIIVTAPYHSVSCAISGVRLFMHPRLYKAMFPLVDWRK